MALKTTKISDLSAQQKSLFDSSKKAIAQHNHGYAFQMLRTLLQSTPGCMEARLVLRLAQHEKFGDKVSPMQKLTAMLRNAYPVFVRGPLLLRKGKIAEAFDVAERAMECDPSSAPTIFFLVRCAEAAGWATVAVNALETGLRFSPQHISLLRTLADWYEKVGDVNRSLQVRQQLCALRPDDLSLQNTLKQTTARAAMEQGKWEEADSFRDIVKDRDQAQVLEQQERIGARDEETLANLVRAAEQKVAEQPTPANLKKLADLYQQSGDFDKALESYNRVIEQSGTMDPAIDTAMTKVLVMRFDDAIKQWRAYAAEDETRQAEAEQNIAEIEKQKGETILERYQERVQRYPNDATYRFELGELHFQRDEIDEALKQFQAAQRNPKLRARTQAYMGKCMSAKGLTDMAIEQLSAALEGTERMGSEKKDILHSLALLYADAGKDEEALKHLKEIYAVDADYRDVGQRIEKHYKSQSAE